jgi:hypothetical protein
MSAVDIEKEHVGEVKDVEHSITSKEIETRKTTKDGILLIPQPSDDPEEPLVSFSVPFHPSPTARVCWILLR